MVVPTPITSLSLALETIKNHRLDLLSFYFFPVISGPFLHRESFQTHFNGFPWVFGFTIALIDINLDLGFSFL